MKTKMSDNDQMTVAMCREVHKQSLEQFSRIEAALDTLNARLYKDNGTISIQTRLDRQARAISSLVWVLGILGTAIIVELVAFGSEAIKYLIRVLPA